MTALSYGLRTPVAGTVVERNASPGQIVGSTSNVFTGAAGSVATHPIHQFLAAGCDVVLGDDNPITVDTRLSREVGALAAAGLDDEALERIEQTAIERAFCEPGVRAALRAGVPRSEEHTSELQSR